MRREINLNDQNGGDLTGNHYYQHFNPAAGVTYKVTPWLTAYAGYADANRAPTPAELSCAGPADSCSLANFFVGDPNLKQVVSHTVEAGLRGTVGIGDDGHLNYNLGLYRSNLDDDIIFVNSVTLNRAFFTNVGQTRRQGVDASIQYKTPRWSAYLTYTYTDATYQSGFVEAAGSNPAADANGNITINPGDRLPGVPAQSGQAGGDLQDHRPLDGRRCPDGAKRAISVRRRGQPDAATARLRHAEPEHQLSAHAAHRSCSPRSRT